MLKTVVLGLLLIQEGPEIRADSADYVECYSRNFYLMSNGEHLGLSAESGTTGFLSLAWGARSQKYENHWRPLCVTEDFH